jgi:hypothetical protein
LPDVQKLFLKAFASKNETFNGKYFGDSVQLQVILMQKLNLTAKKMA